MSREKIKKLLQHHTEVIQEMLSFESMVRGTFYVAKTKCGKPTCRCAQGYLHTHARLTWSEEGKQHTQKITEKQEGDIVRLTAAYKKYRQLFRQLVKVEEELRLELEKFEWNIVKRSHRAVLK